VVRLFAKKLIKSSGGEENIKWTSTAKKEKKEKFQTKVKIEGIFVQRTL
jgi:hypothetical protein